MDQTEDDPQELERKIEQASRIASRINDHTTVQRLLEFVERLRQRRRERQAGRRAREAIQMRAWELWDEAGRPADRDLEFWLQAEDEINGRSRE